MPSVRSNQGYDPVPPSNSVIRYDCTPAPLPIAQMANGGSLISEFFASILPNYVVPGDGRQDWGIRTLFVYLIRLCRLVVSKRVELIVCYVYLVSGKIDRAEFRIGGPTLSREIG